MSAFFFANGVVVFARRVVVVGMGKNRLGKKKKEKEKEKSPVATLTGHPLSLSLSDLLPLFPPPRRHKTPKNRKKGRMPPKRPAFPQSIALYRFLLRKIKRQLPPEARDHYAHAARQGFVAFEDEGDPHRIDQIVARARADAEWIVNKYPGWEKKGKKGEKE